MKDTSVSRPYHALLTVPFAGAQVPVRFASSFGGLPNLNFDIGSIASEISNFLGIECFKHYTTKELVNVQASLGSAFLFSKISGAFADEEKQHILERYYFPYRLRISDFLRNIAKPVVWVDLRSATLIENAWQWSIALHTQTTLNTIAQLNKVENTGIKNFESDLDFQQSIAEQFKEAEIAFVQLLISEEFFLKNKQRNVEEICWQLAHLRF
jgi:hypothetical protein